MTAAEKGVLTQLPLDYNREPGPFTQLHSIPLTEQQEALAQMSPRSSTSWLNGFTITEGSGAAVGAIGGGALGYALGAQFGTAGAMLLNSMGRGQSVLPLSEVSKIATLVGLRTSAYGALAGLALAGVGYGAYKGYEYALAPESTA